MVPAPLFSPWIGLKAHCCRCSPAAHALSVIGAGSPWSIRRVRQSSRPKSIFIKKNMASAAPPCFNEPANSPVVQSCAAKVKKRHCQNGHFAWMPESMGFLLLFLPLARGRGACMYFTLIQKKKLSADGEPRALW